MRKSYTNFQRVYLYLNSTFADHIEVALSKTAQANPPWQQVPGRDVLAAAVGIILRAKRKRSREALLSDLTGVVVVPGPGPFSRVRAGVSVANTLSFARDLPVWTLRAGKLRRMRGLVMPHYGKEPNITKPRT